VGWGGSRGDRWLACRRSGLEEEVGEGLECGYQPRAFIPIY
jgi:hypothetical protein